MNSKINFIKYKNKYFDLKNDIDGGMTKLSNLSKLAKIAYNNKDQIKKLATEIKSEHLASSTTILGTVGNSASHHSSSGTHDSSPELVNSVYHIEQLLNDASSDLENLEKEIENII